MKKCLQVTAAPLLISAMLIGSLIAAFASSAAPVAAQEGYPAVEGGMFEIVDALPDVDGINVRLGPWSFLEHYGWTDIEVMTISIAQQVEANLGIPSSPTLASWGGFISHAYAFNYDFFSHCMHSGVGNMFDRYYQMFVGTDYMFDHFGDYRNPELVDLIAQLDRTIGEEQQAVADQIVRIMGQEVPLIPSTGHPDWYQYNDQYWGNWPNEDNPIMPAGPYGGSVQTGPVDTIVLGLEPNTAMTTEREQTLVMAGYEASPMACRPRDSAAGSAGIATFFMYEPMFGVNIATGELICWLGESIEWIDSTTIEIKLRDEATWSDGTPITSDDAIYSFRHHGAVEGISWAAGDAGPLKDRVESWQKVDDKTFRVNLYDNCPYSGAAWTHLTRSYLIIPKHVWEEIEASGADMLTYANDFTDAAMPAEWKVYSGMYVPTWHDDRATRMERNDDWWGEDVFGKLPAPKYIFHTTYATNQAAALDLAAGNLDWDGKPVPDVVSVMEEAPFVHTYYSESPYYPQKSTRLIVPNHHKYPVNEGWLHRAIAMVIDYDLLNELGGGYFDPNTDFLCLCNDDRASVALVDPAVKAEYDIEYDVDGAIALLAEHCYLIDDTTGEIIANPTSAVIAAGGVTWYTKDGPSQEWLELYGYTPITTTTTTTTAPPSEVWTWVAAGIGVVVVIAIVALVLMRRK